jgi:4-hydroxy-4-methyl-2-oxoglutarate aldolase
MIRQQPEPPHPSTPVVVRHVHRAPLDLVDQLAPIGTATVHEAIGRRGYVGPQLTPIQQGARIAGTAVTALCHPGDNLMIHAAIEFCQEGDVLVVANTAPSNHGMFGDLLATSLLARGVRGLVIDAGVRDSSDLRAMGFPVWSRYVSCQGTVKASPGSVNVPILVGQQIVHPGDVVCADDDGVVIVAREEAAWAIERSKDRLAKEEASRRRLEAGELGIDIYGLRAKIEELGVVYVDRL